MRSRRGTTTIMATEHRGQEIRFDQDDETWLCDKLGLAEASLKKLKKKIENIDAEDRTVNKPALYIEKPYWDSDRAKLTPVTITKIADRGGQDRGYVWIKFADKREREKVRLDSLAPDTAEARAAGEKWLVTVKADALAKKAEEAAHGAIPRIELDEKERAA